MKRRFIISDFLSESYEDIRGFGCVSHTKRAANPVFASDGRLIPGWSLCFTRVLISLALSLALAASGCTISLQSNEIKLVPVAGLEPARLFKVPGF